MLVLKDEFSSDSLSPGASFMGRGLTTASVSLLVKDLFTLLVSS